VRIYEVGWEALLIECDTAASVEAWRALLWRARDEGRLAAREIVPGARTILLDGVPDPAALAGVLGGWSATADAGAGGVGGTGAVGGTGGVAGTGPRRVVLPTVYDGEDLALVAGYWGVSRREVVDRHLSTEFRVAFCGFAPGFGYLTGLPEELAVPRLATPRTRVPAGSVALAGPYAGVYPGASPGGWLLIGRTDAVLFDPGADPPALLAPGTVVRFVEAGADAVCEAREGSTR
jgi:KipI family sensor histidine kinase inhibitor